MNSQLFSPLEPNPILAHARKPERRLPLLISCLVYAGIAYLGYHWKMHQKAVPKVVLETRSERMYVIDLANVLPDIPKPEDASQDNAGGGSNDKDQFMPPGTGTIDPELLKFQAVDALSDPSLLADQPSLPTPATPAFLGTKNLAIAKGGDGRPRGGRGTGDGDGTGNGPPGKGSMTLRGEDLDFVNYVKPEYPRAAVAANLEGVVWVRVTITEDGRPIDAKALSGPEIFIPNTLKAVKNWHFASLRRKGIHGNATVDVSVLFMLIYK